MAIGVVVGAILGAGDAAFAGAHVSAPVRTISAAVAIGAGANAINDVHDIEIDRINRPSRPLPSGVITVESARWLWVALSIAGIMLAARVSAIHLLIAALSVGLLWAYSAQLKGLPAVGNLAVAVVVGLALPFGGLAVLEAHSGRLSVVLAGGAFAFLTTLAREIVKDIEDLPGDAAQRARTLPIVAGTGVAAVIAVIILLLTAMSLPLVAATGISQAFLPLSLPAAMLLLAAVWHALAATSGPEARRQQGASRASAALKGAMVAGLFALAAAAL